MLQFPNTMRFWQPVGLRATPPLFQDLRPSKESTIIRSFDVPPSFPLNMKTYMRRIFLILLGKHFMQTSRYRWLFNRHNIRVSFSCMSSVKKNLVNAFKPCTETGCSRRFISECSAGSQWNYKPIVYTAKLVSVTAAIAMSPTIHLAATAAQTI